MVNGNKIAFFGCKHTTLECIDYFIKNIGQVDYLITISEQKAKQAEVAGYMNLKLFAKNNNIQIYFADKYSLKSNKDYEYIKKNGINIAFVIGWQRLIPSKLLNKVNFGFYGMHGSSDDLPKGRGRSPMNWALIMGKKIFYTNLFKYDSSIDGGGIVGTKKFIINDYDTIQTLHYKNTLAMCFLIKKSLLKLFSNKIKLKIQDDSQATYFPKRNPEDGVIDWTLSNFHLRNFTRALTKPFPGAFSYINNEKIIIWQLFPFMDDEESKDLLPGTIVSVFANNTFSVKTGDGTVLIDDYFIERKDLIKVGANIKSTPFLKIYKKIEKRYGIFVRSDHQKEITLNKIKKIYK